ncbi:MAG TPA: MarR family transcriptional regulator [Actinomycetota bacterium]|nr:MarR family transcriptional regulator [Actinomycetota bacterium]
MSNDRRRSPRDDLIDRVGQEIYEFQNAADAVDDAVAAVLGLNPTDQRCLGLLVLRGPMTAGRLARHASVSAGAMTASLDRLEEAGYVRRVRDEGDRRRVVVEATPEAREAAWSLYRPLAEEGARRLSGYTNEQLRMIVQFLHDATELQLAYADRLRMLVSPAEGSSIGSAVRTAAERLKAARREAKSLARGIKIDLKLVTGEMKKVRNELKAELKAELDDVKRELR